MQGRQHFSTTRQFHARFFNKSYYIYLLIPGILLATSCSDKPAPAWSGYAEGDYVYIAAPLAGRLDSIAVKAGQNIKQGEPLFALDAENEQAASAEAAARLAASQAQVANLETGQRAEEIAVSKAQLQQAEANAALARRELQRQQQLVARGFVSRARLDEATSAFKQARARVRELALALQVAKLPARHYERAASRASATAAKEVVRQTEWRAAQKRQVAPADAVVSDVYFRQGEFVPAGQAVLSLLPPQNIKARFFVPEPELATISLGQTVMLSCDGCGNPIPAQISRIATQPEYTPPLIYSNSQREKMVFMVEAQPGANSSVLLKPGQPLDVRLARKNKIK